MCRQYVDYKHRFNKKETLADVEKNFQSRDSFIRGRQEYIHSRNENDGRTPRMTGREVTVAQVARNYQHAEEFIGILWPEDKWLKHFKHDKLPAGKKKTSVKRGNTSFTGVFETESSDFIPGCIKITKDFEQGVEMTEEGESSFHGGEEAVKAVWKEGCSAHTFSPGSASAPPSNKKRGADAVFYNEMLPPPPPKSKKGEEAAPPTPTPTESTRPGSGTSDSKQTATFGEGDGNTPSATRRRLSGKSLGASPSSSASFTLARRLAPSGAPSAPDKVGKKGRPRGQTLATRMKELGQSNTVKVEVESTLAMASMFSNLSSMTTSRLATLAKKRATAWAHRSSRFTSRMSVTQNFLNNCHPRNSTHL